MVSFHQLLTALVKVVVHLESLHPDGTCDNDHCAICGAIDEALGVLIEAGWEGK